ncbi:MAG TPA: VWA domain-containing protein [Luteitalea sp.]|nr:VWA domain-containing protein [Luteitalea sp.]
MAPPRWSFVASLTALLTTAVWAQTRPNPNYPGSPASSPIEPQRFETTSTAIVVDVVVRDAKGHPITDLPVDAFELYEDQVRQSIGSFSVANRGAGIAVSARRREGTTMVGAVPPAESGTTDDGVPADAGLTALVFDRLSPDSRTMAQRAALAAIPRNGTLPDHTAVFAIDLRVNQVQGFTRDASAVRGALQQIEGLSASQFQKRDRRIVELQERRTQMAPQLASTVQQQRQVPTQGGLLGIGSLEVELAQNRMESRMLEMFDTLEREQQGYGTTNALLSVVASLQELPGRKTIVFFSEGLAVPPAAQFAFRSVVDTANRANVTIYSVDASGLRAESSIADVRREMTAAATDRITQIETGALPVGGSMLRVLERNEDLLRMDPHTGLGDLARDTGGFLVRDTNDLRSAFQRIDEDMRFHYVLTYAPQNQVFDGKFREIDVKVAQPGARVFARRGYFAVRSLAPMPILGYESVPLAALDRTPLPNAFPIRAGGLSFPESKRPGLTSLMVAMDTTHLQYDVDRVAGTYAAEAVVVMRVRDTRGRVVFKTSQQYLLSGQLHELDAAKAGEIIFYRQPELLPGAYSVEAMAYDAKSTRSAARISTVSVPAPESTHARVSSVVVVRRSERVAAGERDAANPLYVGDLLLYPDIGVPTRKASDRELAFFFTAYGRGRATRGRIDLLSQGRVVSSVALDAMTFDQEGRFPQLQRIPIDGLAPGLYELRVSVSDERGGDSKTTAFRIAAP